MEFVGDEPDYLVRAQPEVNPHSFQEVVREAFLLEHDCRWDKQIAEVLGVDKSRVSQMLKHPEILKLESIDNLLGCLSGSEHRRHIVRAWALACFGEDIDTGSNRRMTGKAVTRKTLKRLDRQIREARLATAAHLAEEAASKTDDWVLRQQFLDRAYFAYQRLDAPGHAMRIARRIVEGAEARGDRHRMAMGHLLRARILLGMHTSGISELEAVLAEAEALVASSEVAAGEEPYLLCDGASLEHFRENAAAEFMRRGVLPIDEGLLRRTVTELTRSLGQSSLQRDRHTAHLTLATTYLLLGETFQAQEHLDGAFRAGSVKNVQVYETCGLLKGRILALTESPEAAAIHFRELSDNCRKSQSLYHRRLAEYELAYLESSMMSAKLPPNGQSNPD